MGGCYCLILEEFLNICYKKSFLESCTGNPPESLLAIELGEARQENWSVLFFCWGFLAYDPSANQLVSAAVFMN